MTELLSHIDTPSDAELISRVRGGDVAAYGELFSRHVDAANRLARQLVRGPDADDLVSEAFAKVLQVVQGGGGPDVAFRAYLLTSVRRLHVDKIRAGSRLQTTDDLTPFDPGIPFQDTAVAGFESGAAAKAFASLPERWQLVLWHLEVEGQKPAEIAPLLGMSANSVSALAYRAREGLRQAFLTMHLSDISDTSCRWVNEHLGAYVRNGLAKRDAAKVRGHLDECRRCTAMYLELTEVNSNLSGIIAPLLLGAAATGYLASTGGAVGTAGVLGVLGRVRDTVMANAGAATAGAVAAGVAAAAVVGITLTTGKSENTTTGADKPIGVVSSAPVSPGSSPNARKSRRTTPSAAASPSAAAPSATVPPAQVPGLLVPQAPGPADQPPAGAPGTDAPPAEPGDGPTGNPGSGSSDNPGSGSTDNPGSDPSGNPGDGPTDNPSGNPSDQPGGNPSDGPSDNPSGGGEPSRGPSENPNPGPGSVQADVSVEADLGPTSNSVTLTVHGSATLPPALDVALASDPGGISFATEGPCDFGSTTSVHCVLVGGAGGGAQAPTSSVAVAADASVALTLYFDIPADQPATRVSLSVSVPDGYDDPNLGDNVGVYTYTPATPTTSPSPSESPAPLPEAPLVMGNLTPQQVTPDNDGRYQVSAHVDGLPKDFDGPLTFELAGQAAFDSAPADCTVVDPHQVTCPTGGAGNLDPHFVLSVPSTAVATPISITVKLPDGYTDTSGDPLDNSATALLLAKSNPKADVSVTNLRPDPSAAEGDGKYMLTADVAGFPTDPASPSPAAVYTLVGPATLVGSSTDGCTITDADTGAKTLTCTSPKDGSLVFQVAADGAEADTEVMLSVAPLSGYDDDDSTNNTSNPVTLTAPRIADLGLALPGTTDEAGHDPGANRFLLDATVSGLPAGTQQVVLSKSDGGAFVDGQGCTAAGASVTCSVQPDGAGAAVVRPVVSYDGSEPVDVSVTAVTPAGYVDPTPASGTTTLRPEPADGLTATASLAFPDGDRTNGRLTVTVDGAADGHSLTLALEGKNESSNGIRFADVTGGPCTAGDQTATCASEGTFVFAVDVPRGLLSGTVTVSDGAHDPARAGFSAPAETPDLLTPGSGPPTAGADVLAGVTGPLARVTHTPGEPGSDGLPKAVQRETERRTSQVKPRAHARHVHGRAKEHKQSGHKTLKSLRHGQHGHGKHSGGHGGAVRLLLGGLLSGLGR